MFVNDDVDDESAVCRTLTLAAGFDPFGLQRHETYSHNEHAKLKPRCRSPALLRAPGSLPRRSQHSVHRAPPQGGKIRIYIADSVYWTV